MSQEEMGPELFYFAGTVFLVVVAVIAPTLLSAGRITDKSAGIRINEGTFWGIFLATLFASTGSAASLAGIVNIHIGVPLAGLHEFMTVITLFSLVGCFTGQFVFTWFLMGRIFPERWDR